MEELKPCPYCGGHAILDFSGGNKTYFDENGEYKYTDFTYVVKCENCLAQTGNYVTPGMAVKAWNRRIPV